MRNQRICTLVIGVAACLATLHGAASAAAPTRIAWLTSMGGASDIRVDGQRQLAYMATQSGCMAVIDVQAPSNPWLRGWARDGCAGNAIDQQDVVVAVASGTSGVHIFDVSNPSLPVRTGFVPGTARGVAVLAGRVYAAMHVGSATVFQTLSLDGAVLGERDLGSLYVADMAACGGRVHVAARGGRVLSIDVRNDAAPAIGEDFTFGDTPSWGVVSLACDMATGTLYAGRYRTTATSTQPVLSTKAKPVLQTPARLAPAALWIDAGYLYGYGSTLGRIPMGTWGPHEEDATPKAGAVAAANGLLFTSYGSISTVSQRGGLQIFTFGDPPQPTATQPIATPTRPPATSTVQPSSTPTATRTGAVPAATVCVCGQPASCQ